MDCIYRKSFVKYDALTIAMGSLLLATKLEEKSKILRDVILVFHRIYQRRKGYCLKFMQLGGIEYNAWKE